jgi:hypothetical protein
MSSNVLSRPFLPAFRSSILGSESIRGFDSRPRRQSIFDFGFAIGLMSILRMINNYSREKCGMNLTASKFTFAAEPERCAVAFEEHPRRRR